MSETELTAAQQQDIMRRTGWSMAVVGYIRTMAEAELYIEAGLTEMYVNEKVALIQPSIDPKFVMPEWWVKEHGESWRGWTNADLMGEGYPPHDEKGDPYELHHIGQLSDSPLAELTWHQHHEDGNFGILHTFDDNSDIERPEFVGVKSQYWQARFKNFSRSELKDIYGE